jgi:two-component system NarL family sensor kinase
MSGRWCLCTDQFRQGKLTPTNIDVLECSRLHPAVARQDQAQTGGLRFHASIPLYFRQRGLGIMNIAGPSWRALSDEELELLSIIASQIGIAVERARLGDESTRLARAEERTRIAREIHDTLAQGLTAIGLDIESALRNLEAHPDRARERLARALNTARANLEEARHSVLDLRATPLAGRPLPEALAALGRAFTSQTGLQVHVHVAGAECSAAPIPPDLPIRVEAELYRIVQEALANVGRHAQASAVEITLRLSERGLLLSVRDDGIGIDDARSSGGESDGLSGRDGHHGIVGMRERARLIGGRLRLTSRPSHGTTVTVSVPRDQLQATDSPTEQPA